MTSPKPHLQPEHLLQVESLDAFYGGAQVLHHVSLAVKPGEAVVLVGRNGAGKSTTLKAIIGLEARRNGRIRLDGAEIIDWSTHRIARAGIAYVPEDRRIFRDLTVAENLAVAGLPTPTGSIAEPWSEAQVFTLFPPLAEITGRRAGFLSGGEQQMLAIGRALMGNPRLLLLDEPSEGLAPIILDRIAEAIIALKHRGVALLVSEQNLAFVGDFGDTAVILETGVVRYDGPLAELSRDPKLAERYLAVP